MHRLQLIRIILVAVVVSSCGGKLSEEQRKRLQEGMSTMDIKRVSDAELHEAALRYGKEVATVTFTVDRNLMQKKKIDSLSDAYHVTIFRMMPNDSALRSIEKQLMEAYLLNANIQDLTDNVQKTGQDSLLFTRPVFRDRPDGSQEFNFAIAIRMPVKTVILRMPKP